MRRQPAHSRSSMPSPAYLAESKSYVRIPVFDGARLLFGHRLDGPCIVERPGDTLVIPPSMRGLVDEFHNIRIETIMDPA